MLQEAHVDLIDLDLCNSTRWYNGRIRSTNVCAGYPEGKIDTCQVTLHRVRSWTLPFWIPEQTSLVLFSTACSHYVLGW